MSSGFVSGGTIDKPVERDDEWRAAQAELEAKRREKEDRDQQHDGKSLFEVLQANKAAKQEAFEEATRLKNQYRALDDDEAEFLDSLHETTRKKEAELRKETLEQLDGFRKRQEEAERGALNEHVRDDVKGSETAWVNYPRKRKKEPELLKGVKLRKAGSMASDGRDKSYNVQLDQKHVATSPTRTSSVTPGSLVAPTAAPPKNATPASLGLGYDSSDDD